MRTINLNYWQNQLRYRYSDVVRRQNINLKQRSLVYSFAYSNLFQEIDNYQLIISETSNSNKIEFLQAEPGNSKCLKCHKSQCELILNHSGLLVVPTCENTLCYDCIMNWIDESQRESVISNKIYAQLFCPICFQNLFTYMI
jgi:hypothetical protein